MVVHALDLLEQSEALRTPRTVLNPSGEVEHRALGPLACLAVNFAATVPIHGSRALVLARDAQEPKAVQEVEHHRSAKARKQAVRTQKDDPIIVGNGIQPSDLFCNAAPSPISS